MTFHYKDKKINISDEVAKTYKGLFGKCDEEIIDYTIITGHLDLSNKNIDKEIEELLIEEMETHLNAGDILKAKGLL